MRKYALILGGGSGTRAGGRVPKQFQSLGDCPVIWHSVRNFLGADPNTRICMVINDDYRQKWETACHQLAERDSARVSEIIPGGRSRLESVRNGLEWIARDCGNPEDVLVAVHDGARPFADPEMIAQGWKVAAQYGSAIPAVAMTDTIRELIEDDRSEVRDRSRYVRIQTPQMFKYGELLEAYRCIDPLDSLLTDDASVMERSGITPHLYHGNDRNIKITNPIDFSIAEAILKHIET